MPRVDYVEKTIFAKEGVDVKFYKNGLNVRGDLQLPSNYKTERMTKNVATISFLLDKMQKSFPGYDFKAFDADGNEIRGNTQLGNIRDQND